MDKYKKAHKERYKNNGKLYGIFRRSIKHGTIEGCCLGRYRDTWDWSNSKFAVFYTVTGRYHTIEQGFELAQYILKKVKQPNHEEYYDYFIARIHSNKCPVKMTDWDYSPTMKNISDGTFEMK